MTTYYGNAQQQFNADKATYGDFVVTKPMKSDKGSYFYNDRITWYVCQSKKIASRKDEQTGVMSYYTLEG